MPRRKSAESIPKTPEFPAAFNREERENQLIALAYDLVEQRLRDGTASSQETSLLLRAGSTRERLERQLMEKNDALLAAKKEAIDAQKQKEQTFEKVLAAMKKYQGYNEPSEIEEFHE